MRSALEVISLAARTGGMQDPKEPRGTRGGLTYADICHALAMTGDRIGSDMALMVACQDVRKRDEISGWLAHEVVLRCNADGFVPDLLKVADAVDQAMTVALFGGNHRGGSRYFRWAYRELMCRAENTAENAVRRLRKAA